MSDPKPEPYDDYVEEGGEGSDAGLPEDAPLPDDPGEDPEPTEDQ